MSQTLQEKNKTLLLAGFDVLFNKRDFIGAEKYWSPNYIQHSSHIEPGRDGLFNLVKSLPSAIVVVDIMRIKDGVFEEHWDVIQPEATREESKSKLPMFGDTFPR